MVYIALDTPFEYEKSMTCGKYEMIDEIVTTSSSSNKNKALERKAQKKWKKREKLLLKALEKGRKSPRKDFWNV